MEVSQENPTEETSRCQTYMETAFQNVPSDQIPSEVIIEKIRQGSYREALAQLHLLKEELEWQQYPSNGHEGPQDNKSKEEEEELGEDGEDDAPCMGICGFPCCGRFRFPYLFMASLVQFAIYLNKIYQDSNAAKTYYESGDIQFLALSAAALVAPALMYIVFSVGSRLINVTGGKRASCSEAFTGLINGLLLVPWQIKGRAEVLQFCSQRICARRAPTRNENVTVNTLRRQASVLEFFEEFYAGLLQLLLQLYLMLPTIGRAANDKMIIGEVVASTLALIATVKAISRKDDGPLTSWLSRIGWLSLFTARCLALALAAQVLHAWTAVVCAGIYSMMLFLSGFIPIRDYSVHVLAMTIWVSRIAWDSHQTPEDGQSTPTPLTKGRRASIFFLVLCLFGLPSLMYWPFMFQLKDRHRPLIFLLVTGLENAALFAVWFFGGGRHRSGTGSWSTIDMAFVGILFGGLLLGSLCLALYNLCKPKLTDQVVRHDMKVLNANSYGIFYDFCEVTFRLPATGWLSPELRRIRAAAHNS